MGWRQGGGHEEGWQGQGGGPCGSPPASVPLPVVVVVASLPQPPVGWGRGAARRCGG
jgi:hypothetical protein